MRATYCKQRHISACNGLTMFDWRAMGEEQRMDAKSGLSFRSMSIANPFLQLDVDNLSFERTKTTIGVLSIWSPNAPLSADNIRAFDTQGPPLLGDATQLESVVSNDDSCSCTPCAQAFVLFNVALTLIN